MSNVIFLMLRHGSTLLNESGLYRGWSNGPDAELDDNGRKNAMDAAAFLFSTQTKIKNIICSDLNRTLETAVIVGSVLGVEDVEVDERLRPLNVGDLAGQPKEQYPIDEYLHDKDKRFPNGETVNEFEARQHEVSTEIIDRIQSGQIEMGTLLVVAHVSNVMYWDNLQKTEKDEEYLHEKTDLVGPGGLVLVTDFAVIPVIKNKVDGEEKSQPKEKEPEKVNQWEVAYLPADRVGYFGTRCGECWKFIKTGRCVEVEGRIEEDKTCINYVHGTPFKKDPEFELAKLSKEVVGYDDGDTNCGRCEYFGGYDKCQKVKGYDGKDNVSHIEEKGCCDSYSPK